MPAAALERHVILANDLQLGHWHPSGGA